jgi:phospholipid N-methyltransferase
VRIKFEDPQRAIIELTRRNFLFFLMRAFPYISGGRQLDANWHLSAMAYELERVRQGSNLRLLVNLPPRNLKSITISIAWVTAAALAKLKRSATLIAIETGEDFIEHLRSSLGDDDRLRIVHGSARNVLQTLRDHRLEQADCIVSGLPFSTLSADEAEQIVAVSANALHPSGMFAAYQIRRAIEPLLRRHFNVLTKAYEWWNIPPCHLYWAKNPIIR